MSRASILRPVVAAVAMALAGAPFAAAETICEAQTHERYGETRAVFQDVWAGCDAAGACQMSASRLDRSMPLNFSHELRFILPRGASALAMQLTSVADDVDLAAPAALAYGRQTLDLTGGLDTRDNVVNQYHVRDAAKADAAAREMIAKARTARWTYASKSGETKAVELPLRGAAKALAWVGCMANR